MAIVKLDPKVDYANRPNVGDVYFTKRGNNFTAKAHVISERRTIVEFYPDEEGIYSQTNTLNFRIWNNDIRDLRDYMARATHQETSGLSICRQVNDVEVSLRKDNEALGAHNKTLIEEIRLLKSSADLRGVQGGCAKLMLSVGSTTIASYKEKFNLGDSFVLINNKESIGFANVSSKASIVLYDKDGRYVKTFPAGITSGNRTNGDVREKFKEIGLNGLLHVRGDRYAEAYGENVGALLKGLPAPFSQLLANPQTAPQQTGGQFILWAPNSNIPPRRIMEGRNQANAIADDMFTRHGKTFYVCQLVRKVEAVTVKTVTKKVTDLV